MILNDSN